jgi:hypothetical protein
MSAAPSASVEQNGRLKAAVASHRSAAQATPRTKQTRLLACTTYSARRPLQTPTCINRFVQAILYENTLSDGFTRF